MLKYILIILLLKDLENRFTNIFLNAESDSNNLIDYMYAHVYT